MDWCLRKISQRAWPWFHSQTSDSAGGA
jgi:hypothetical protein